MHSRIIQIETSPISSMIMADDYSDHWFTTSIADYVDEDYDPKETIDALQSSLKSCGDRVEFFTDEEGRGVIFREGFQQSYFAMGYEAFREALQMLGKTATLEKYCSDAFWQELYDLNSAYDNEVGYYIQNDELGLKTLSRYMRLARIDTKY